MVRPTSSFLSHISSLIERESSRWTFRFERIGKVHDTTTCHYRIHRTEVARRSDNVSVERSDDGYFSRDKRIRLLEFARKIRGKS